MMEKFVESDKYMYGNKVCAIYTCWFTKKKAYLKSIKVGKYDLKME